MLGSWTFESRVDSEKLGKRHEEPSMNEGLKERFRKSLYYGEMPKTDRPSLPLTDLAVEYFQGAVPRKLGHIDTYMASSMTRRACVSPCSVVMSMIYAKRLRHRNPDYLQQISSSDLFFISMMMASKYLYDEGVDEEVFNDEWAESANQETEDVNQMERDFLSAMDWQLFVSEEEFMNVVRQTEKRIAWNQGIDRGWFTYSDLSVLLDNPNLEWMLQNIGREWMKVVTVSSAAYVAGLLTMIGSTVLALQVSPAVTIVGTAILNSPHPVFDHRVSQPVFPAVTSGNESVVIDEHLANRNFMESELSDVGDKMVVETVPDVNLLERVLPQLWAVVALKDRFVQFVRAVSEGYQFAKPRPNTPKKNNCYRSCSSLCHHHDNHLHRNNLNPALASTVSEKQSEMVEGSGSGFRTSNHEDTACSGCTANRKSAKTCPYSTKDAAPLGLSNRVSCLLAQSSSLDAFASGLLAELVHDMPQCCYHGNRPPDTELEHSLEGPQFQGVVRGFATSPGYQVPTAA